MTIYFPVGVGKPLLRIQGCIENKKCSPEKVSIIWFLQIDTLPLEFIHLELAFPRPEQFWANAKIEDFNFKNKKSYVKKSTVFNFL